MVYGVVYKKVRFVIIYLFFLLKKTFGNIPFIIRNERIRNNWDQRNRLIKGQPHTLLNLAEPRGQNVKLIRVMGVACGTFDLRLTKVHQMDNSEPQKSNQMALPEISMVGLTDNYKSDTFQVFNNKNKRNKII